MNTRHTTTGRTRRTRRGFTLVEMMVAMALSLGIMLILAEAFQRSLDFVRIANANSQLMNQLAGTGNLLEHDLSAEHFLPESGKPNGGVRLSDQRMDRPGWTRPTGGFFHIDAPQPIYEMSGGVPLLDREGNTLSSATNHRLHFTSIFRGNSDSELFVGVSPVNSGNVYKTRAAEVAWYLVPTGERTSPNAGSLPLYTLVRRYNLVAMDDDSRSSLQQAIANDPGVAHRDVISVVPNANPALDQANTLATVANPANRLQLGAFNGPGPTPLAGARTGEEVVLTNVLSFQVLVWWDGNTAIPTSRSISRPYGTTLPLTSGPPNTEGPYDYLFQGGGTFDTFAPVGAPAPFHSIRVRSIQITVRIADTRVGIARSNTWRFAM